ncbi:MAG: Glu-tRNA(Gln) amidotransferase subunit GatE [Nanoarchaeota archaeon]|nr:Glu-tRNA(Gln) amidotransferase subunit GatE [Nanoarchaeota archaeon]
MTLDYKKIGLKCGLEIHQQLDTHKLFCSCPSILRDDSPHFEVRRKLKALAGELGKVDVAAKAEEKREKTYIYQGYNDTTCLVELDEEPPHKLNEEALEIALQIALLLNMKPFDEIQIMRKTVVDGSNTSGFQRTALIAEDGYIETSQGKVRVNMIALEEDSARRISETPNSVTFRLDRLGIPLVELRTEPDIFTPQMAKEAAERIGLLMRMTGKVKRGIGTIRQDVNISIKGGTRVEIKGVQDLREIPKMIDLEIERQQNLIEISKKLKQRKPRFEKKFYDIKKIFEKTNSNLIKKAIEREDDIIAVKVSGFNGLLKKKIQGEKHLARDIVEYVKHFTGLRGFIHSDELPNYGISENEVFQIRKFLGCKNEDAFAFVIAERELAEKALSHLIDRCQQYLRGVPKDVRDVSDDGTTRFLRPMPGAARMYPETDEIPVPISKELLKKIKVPPTPEERLKRFKKWGLSDDLAKQILHSPELVTFEELVAKFKNISPTIIAATLVSTRDEIRRRYDLDTSAIEKHHFEETFELLNKGKIAKEAIVEILAHLAAKPQMTAEEVMKKLKLQKISIRELRKIISKVLEENEKLAKEKQFGILMGFVMRKVRGRIDGEIVANELKKKLKN